MKIVRDIIDNGRRIIHLRYEEHELKEMEKKHQELVDKMKEDHKEKP